MNSADYEMLTDSIAGVNGLSRDKAEEATFESFSFTFDGKRNLAARYLLADASDYQFVVLSCNDWKRLIGCSYESILAPQLFIPELWTVAMEFVEFVHELVLMEWPPTDGAMAAASLAADKRLVDFANHGKRLEELLAIAKAKLLLYYGVEEWSGYFKAAEAYESADHEAEDSISFVEAMKSGGVEYWRYHREVLAKLSAYRDYLDSFTELSEAATYSNWPGMVAVTHTAKGYRRATETKPLVVAGNGDPTNQALLNHLASNYSEYDPLKLFLALTNEKHLWKINTFPKEFKLATSEIKGPGDTIEKARTKFLELIMKNGKLDKLIKETIAGF
jgi:hypothetical protein